MSAEELTVVPVSKEELAGMFANLGPYLSDDKNDYYGGIVAAKSLLDRREVHVYPLFFGQARLCVGEGPRPDGYSDVWDYPSQAMAIVALMLWDGAGDPMPGWERHSQL